MSIRCIVDRQRTGVSSHSYPQLLILFLYSSVTNRALVYFTFKDLQTLTLSSNGVFVYTTLVASSDLSGYDRTTGIFTASIPGLYLFSVYLCHNSNSYVPVAFVKNSQQLLGSTYENNSYYACHTVQTIVMLSSRDRVWVKCLGSCNLRSHSEYWNTFSGALLQATTSNTCCDLSQNIIV